MRPSSILLVFLGGCVGAGAREALVVFLPSIGQIPVAIVIANLVGALLLGVLLEALRQRRTASVARARLLLGTGAMGGFTTYSSLALGVTEFVIGGQPWLAIAYGAGTVGVGALATVAGLAMGAKIAKREGSRDNGGEGD